METAALPATVAALGESPTMSVHSAKAITAGAPANKQDVEAGVESSPPEVAAPEGREGSKPSVSGDARGESPVEEARDEPAAEEASAPLVEKDAKSPKSRLSKSRGRAIIKEMSIRARSKSKNRSDSILKKKPEEKDEEKKSKLGSLRGKLSSSKFLKKSTKKVKTAEDELSTPLADVAVVSVPDIEEIDAHAVSLTVDERTPSSMESNANSITEEIQANAVSLTAAAEVQATADERTPPPWTAQLKIQETIAEIPPYEKTHRDFAAMLFPVEAKAEKPSEEKLDGEKPAEEANINEAKSVHEAAEEVGSAVSGKPAPSDVPVNVSAIAASIAKITFTTLRSTYSSIVSALSAQDVLGEGLAPTEVKAEVPEEENHGHKESAMDEVSSPGQVCKTESEESTADTIHTYYHSAVTK
ncbi:hypothetical protein THAOC_19300 [Thalassiosira oceanica]|uniref:Uncharacterized protein n=1 Tax=Thalassiosira oceanica TaxID=159749 RepID=K0SH82_THAOC|nr:hypothetical protein THAOC_19300 [Thalassiosira oceanica]|eukprot:EJK60361.1 hypothetical protein THAOC_19300 [Thalassiosira oceanica]